MNPVFIFLVILAAIVLWFLLAGVFYPLGRILKKLWDDAYGEITRDDKKEKED